MRGERPSGTGGNGHTPGRRCSGRCAGGRRGEPEPHDLLVARDEHRCRPPAGRHHLRARSVHAGHRLDARRQRLPRRGGLGHELDGRWLSPSVGHVQHLLRRNGRARRLGDRQARRSMADGERRAAEHGHDHRHSRKLRELPHARDHERGRSERHRRPHPHAGLRIRHAHDLHSAVPLDPRSLPRDAVHGLDGDERKHARELVRPTGVRALRSLAVRRTVRAHRRARERDRQGSLDQHPRARDDGVHHVVRRLLRREPRLQPHPRGPRRGGIHDAVPAHPREQQRDLEQGLHRVCDLPRRREREPLALHGHVHRHVRPDVDVRELGPDEGRAGRGRPPRANRRRSSRRSSPRRATPTSSRRSSPAGRSGRRTATRGSRSSRPTTRAPRPSTSPTSPSRRTSTSRRTRTAPRSIRSSPT